MKVIIVGATSGIGRALAQQYLSSGHTIGITGRREELLMQLKNADPDRVFIRRMDVNQFEPSRKILLDLIEDLGGVDILIVSSGIGDTVPQLDRELEIIRTNASAFINIFRTGLDFMKNAGGGTLVGISSVSAARGFRIMTVYGASKRFISHYMEGIRHFLFKKKIPVKVVDIRPGYIMTAMTEENKEVFWQIPVEHGARLIVKAIKRGHPVAYIPGRWRVIFLLWRILPRWVSYRL